MYIEIVQYKQDMYNDLYIYIASNNLIVCTVYIYIYGNLRYLSNPNADV